MSGFMEGVGHWVKENPLAAKVLEQQSRIEQLERELAAEKAMADRLFKAIDSAYVDYAEDEAEFCAALEAYRKARGLA